MEVLCDVKVDCFTKVMSSTYNSHDPDDGSRHLVKSEFKVVHFAGPRDERGEGTDECDKFTEENSLPAMLHIELVGHFQVLFLKENLIHVPSGPISEFTAQEVAEVIP